MQVTPTGHNPSTGKPVHRIIRHAEVSQKLGIGHSTLWDLVAKGVFPKPFVIVPGGRAVGWLEGDVDTWIRHRSQEAAR